MLKKIMLATLAAATALTAIPAAADAQSRRGYYNDGYYSQPYRGDRYYRGDCYDRYDRRGYASRGYNRGYRDRCRSDGTTGTIIGAIAGGLLGKEVGEGRYDRGDGTAGAIIGGAAGALLGRQIDRSC